MTTAQMERILITGATGNVGLETLRELMRRSDRDIRSVRAGVRDPARARLEMDSQPNDFVALDFADARTFAPALEGVRRVLLVRPPALADVDKYFAPFVEAMTKARVQQVVFLSLQGVENNSLTPHHKIEKLITDARLPFTFLRPSFFMQNLSTTHRDEIRSRDELFVPAGNGRTSFVDVRDIGAVAALALTDSADTYRNKNLELTGSEALTYYEVADRLSQVLGRKITYRDPSIPHFIWQKWYKEGNPFGFTLIMVALYTVSKLGKAARLTNETAALLNRPPILFAQFAQDYKEVWMK